MYNEYRTWSFIPRTMFVQYRHPILIRHERRTPRNAVLSGCRLLVNMTNTVKLLYYEGNTKTQTTWALKYIQRT